jgi:hypothetical protein
MTPRIAIGIDPGASCGVAAVTRDWCAWTTVQLPSWRSYADPREAPAEHTGRLYSAIDECVRALDPGDLDDWRFEFSIEDHRHARSMAAAAQAGWHMQTAIRTIDWWCADVGIQYQQQPPLLPAPSTWQSWHMGRSGGREKYMPHAIALTGGALGEREHDAGAALLIAEWAWWQSKNGNGDNR